MLWDSCSGLRSLSLSNRTDQSSSFRAASSPPRLWNMEMIPRSSAETISGIACFKQPRSFRLIVLAHSLPSLTSAACFVAFAILSTPYICTIGNPYWPTLATYVVAHSIVAPWASVSIEAEALLRPETLQRVVSADIALADQVIRAKSPPILVKKLKGVTLDQLLVCFDQFPASSMVTRRPRSDKESLLLPTQHKSI